MNLKRFLLVSLALFLSACAGREDQYSPTASRTPTVSKFAKRAYNKPYKIKGITYSPQKHYEYREIGIASYYGGRDIFHGRKTSNGETFDKNGLTAAHKTLPIPSVIRVTNLKNGRSLKLRVTDRGPFKKGRIVDVSMRAAQLLGFYRDGLTKVRVETCLNDTLRVAHNGKSSFNAQLTQLKRAPRPSKKPLPKPLILAKKTPLSSDRRVLRPQPQPTPPPRRGIFIQTARSSSLHDAKTQATQFLKKFPQVGVRVAPHKSGEYRVLLGPFRNQSEARLIATSLSGGNAGQ